jgi:protein O-GlcNAc transferase
MKFSEELALALSAHRNGQITKAKRYYREVLRQDPSNILALGWLGTIEAQAKNHLQAKNFLEKALSLDTNNLDFLFNYANLLQEMGQYRSAIGYYEKVLNQKRDPTVIAYLASCYANLGDSNSALTLSDEAIKIDDTCSEAWSNRGAALSDLNLYHEALTSYDRAIKLSPESAETWSNRSLTLSALARHEDALVSQNRAIELRPDFPEAWSNRGLILGNLKRHEEAIESYKKALELNPLCANIWANFGIILSDINCNEEALVSYDRAIKLKSNHAEAWSNRGVSLNQLGRYEEALMSCDQAIKLKSNHAEAWSNRGVSLNHLGRYEEAFMSYEEAIRLKPNGQCWLGAMLHTQMTICNWSNLGARLNDLKTGVSNGENVSNPFALLGLLDCPQIQRKSADTYVREKFGNRPQLDRIAQGNARDKIRIGYFSMDFHNHPVAYLIVELIEIHNRATFEVYGFSFGTNKRGGMRQRIEEAFDKFFDVENLSSIDIARLSRQLEIDIAIDLGGHTQNSRPGIFVERAAPIQINYLGYPGTWGGNAMDYVIGDKVVVTDQNKAFFSEKIIYLPNQFQANPSRRPVTSGAHSKKFYGLPEKAFVFCCFNNNWKITPDTFQMWVRILKQVPHGVLWLHASSSSASHNLERNFQKHGVQPERIIFAKRASLTDYLNQFSYADLFLDTVEYNAGTTASDALSMGVPLITLAGKSFSARMAASLLVNMGLPELVAETPEAYESLAIDLASNSEKFSRLKTKLAENKATASVFNTSLFAKHIEAAYRLVYQRYHSGMEPGDIYVDP